ncbi:peptidoglycan DD-metalloendopeptidase family protein [Enemella sp. A6]|uniref:peptidoglycan DD-metalloendopeptidase family protein n=1 Tax=Enemella sp. A6 TaxID=3440152 RepID=UPI003EC146C6
MNRLRLPGFRLLGAIALTLFLVVVFRDPAHASPTIVRPVPGPVVRAFDPPEHDWLPGHRGVDLSGVPGEPVVAAMSGRIVFAGDVAGQPVVSIDHPDGRRTTYQPVRAGVRTGQQVRAGDPIGTLLAGHCDTAAACLHLGLKRGEEYLDPHLILDAASLPRPVIKLLPASAPQRIAERAATRDPVAATVGAPGGTGSSGAVGSAGSTRPADGPITSPFGMRVHPVTGVYKLHDGLDIGSGCGSPIRAVLPGTVVQSVFHVAYGWWLIIDHGGGLRTGYSHAESWSARVGDQVVAGQQIGRIGTTGYSTGCHLHFMAWRGGRIVNPHPLLP